MILALTWHSELVPFWMSVIALVLYRWSREP